MFVLDTNVISELRHGKPNQSMAVRNWAAKQASNRLFLHSGLGAPHTTTR